MIQDVGSWMLIAVWSLVPIAIGVGVLGECWKLKRSIYPAGRMVLFETAFPFYI